MRRSLRIFIANTDRGWFDFLHRNAPWEEVNFWQPSGSRVFSALNPGELFLFKLKSPVNKIAGGGVFYKGSLLPLSLAWDAFRQSNGSPDLQTMRSRISRYRRTDDPGDFKIGCRIVTSPVFLDEQNWIPLPSGWAPNIVDGKSFEVNSPEITRIWRQFESMCFHQDSPSGLQEPQERFGGPTIVYPRLGQGAFRIGVTDAYSRMCAVTGEKVLPALEACHIRPFAAGGHHAVSNGILFRRDIHSLFDLGYVTVSPELHFEVSRKVKEEYSNGREYYALHGRKLNEPRSDSDKPDASFLIWHNDKVFRP